MFGPRCSTHGAHAHHAQGSSASVIGRALLRRCAWPITDAQNRSPLRGRWTGRWTPACRRSWIKAVLPHLLCAFTCAPWSSSCTPSPELQLKPASINTVTPSASLSFNKKFAALFWNAESPRHFSFSSLPVIKSSPRLSTISSTSLSVS